MIYLLLILDILINNYTKYTSYFFIVFLYNKSFKYYLLTGLILDFIIFNSFFLNTIILVLMYFANKIFKELNKNNIYNFIFINIFNYILFIMLSNIFLFNNYYDIFVTIGKNMILNLIFYLLNFKLEKQLNI